MSLEAPQFQIEFPQSPLIKKERLLSQLGSEARFTYCKLGGKPAWMFFDLLPDYESDEDPNITIRRNLLLDRPDEELIYLISLEAYRLIEFNLMGKKLSFVDFTQPDVFNKYFQPHTQILDINAPAIYRPIDNQAELLINVKSQTLETLYAQRGATYHSELITYLENNKGLGNEYLPSNQPASLIGMINSLLFNLYENPKNFDGDEIIQLAVNLEYHLRDSRIPKDERGNFDIEHRFGFPTGKNISLKNALFLANPISKLPALNQEVILNKILSEPRELRWSALEDIKLALERKRFKVFR